MEWAGTRRNMLFSHDCGPDLQELDIQEYLEELLIVLSAVVPDRVQINLVRSSDIWRVEAAPDNLRTLLMRLTRMACDGLPLSARLMIAARNVAGCAGGAPAGDNATASGHVLVTICESGALLPTGGLELAIDRFLVKTMSRVGSNKDNALVNAALKPSSRPVRFHAPKGDFLAAGIFLSAPAVDNPARTRVFRNPVRILVVDDDLLMRDYLEALLRSMRYIPVIASTGENALERLRVDGHFDLLLTDICLEGGMNGRELARQARALRADLPILFISGTPDEVHDPDARMLRKPFRAKDLSSAILVAMGLVAGPPG